MIMDEIKPIENEHNLIFTDMDIAPLPGYGEELFDDCEHASLLTSMMDRDMYFILDIKNGLVDTIKTPLPRTEENLEKYVSIAVLGLNKCNIEKTFRHYTCEYAQYLVESFCNMEKEPERYYSQAWQNCRKGYQFQKLPE